MRRAAPFLLALQLLAPAPAAAEGRGSKPPEAGGLVFPEGFAGRETAAMKLLFPGWTPSNEELVVPDGGAPVRVHLQAARRWIAEGRTLLAVLLEISGACPDTICGPESTQLAVLSLQGTTLRVVIPPMEVGQHGADVQTDLGTDLLPMSPEAALLPVLGTTVSGRRLRLLALVGKSVQVVFERTIADSTSTPRAAKAAGCEAVVTVDEFGTFPYPLKVKEHCTFTGRTATEIWRWEGTRYLLHGPASDTAASDQGFSSHFDEE